MAPEAPRWLKGPTGPYISLLTGHFEGAICGLDGEPGPAPPPLVASLDVTERPLSPHCAPNAQSCQKIIKKC